MVVSHASAAGLLSSVLIATHSAWNGHPPATIRVTENNAYLAPWDANATAHAPPCSFYNASHQYTTGLCSHIAIARMSVDVQAEALTRALACASYYDTDCVLSSEVGLSVPAAFVYDTEAGLKMLIAPKPLPPEPSEAPPDAQTVALHMPDDGRRTGIQIQFNSSVRVQYLRGVTRDMHEEVLAESDAFCVQLLRASFADDCWAGID